MDSSRRPPNKYCTTVKRLGKKKMGKKCSGQHAQVEQNSAGYGPCEEAYDRLTLYLVFAFPCFHFL